MTDFITTPRGDRVAFDRRGTGPAVVFVAGAGPFRAVDPWTTQTAEAMAPLGVSTIVFDRLGRGESTAEGVLDLERELEVIAALIQEAGGSAVLCGHSSGCSIALKAAVTGLSVDGLALWEAPVAGDSEAILEWVGEVLRRMDAGDLEGALTHYMKDMPPEWLAELRRAPTWPDTVAQTVSLRADAESLAWTASAPHAELFGGIHVPVQVMNGESTYPEMVASAESITASIPGATTRTMPGADHTWEPRAMAAELASFTAAVQDAKGG